MDLTIEYLKYEMKMINRADLISKVDEEISNNPNYAEDLLGISLALDDSEDVFLHKIEGFVNVEIITKEIIDQLFWIKCKDTTWETREGVVEVLKWLLYDVKLITWQDKLGSVLNDIQTLNDMFVSGQISVDAARNDYNRVCLG